MNQISGISKSISKGIDEAELIGIHGRVTQVIGTIIKAVVPNVHLGELCVLKAPGSDVEIATEVVGFSNNDALLTPIDEMHGISTSTIVYPTGASHRVPVGPELLGRALDGMGRPLDCAEKGDLSLTEHYPVYRDAPEPLTRKLIDQALPLGIKAIDGILTCGEGQRMGIFAAAGGGKSTLLGMIVKGAKVDVIVVALIGERGREVREFIEHELGEEALKRSVLVIATSDRSAMERSKSAYVATAIAEYFRDQGQKVLLLMDSVTRFARALREIGLAAGEPPTRRGYPPSVFATLPKLMERSGNNKTGSITALYTVLVEGDDMTEPVADETRSILDGHVILSRELAEAAHYPAIDVLASASRVMNRFATDEHLCAVQKVRSLLANHKRNELLIKIGEYKVGSDKLTDEAIEKFDDINRFLQQSVNESSDYEQTLSQIQQFL